MDERKILFYIKYQSRPHLNLRLPYISLLVILFTAVHLNAQNRANNWYFGFGAGLDFNSGAPIVQLDGQLSTREGCATISDNGGNLMFYTDGATVWNSNHTIMQNGTGLNGHTSSTHSAVIVPMPGSSTEYYIFTVDVVTVGNGFQYSVVDMTLDGGLGGVTTKNVLLFSEVTEKVGSYKKAGSDDYWVITCRLNSNEFLAYEVTALGVNSSPVVSAIGVGNYNGARISSQIKISPDGKRLAIANGWEIQVFDFDETTGSLSNPLTLLQNINSYGIEFSPDSDLLYAAYYEGVCQFDLTAGTQQDIENTKLILNTSAGESFGSLQLGPDGKIYGVKVSGRYLDVIHNPNGRGASCDYRYNDFYLGGRTGFLGLPTFISNIYSLKGTISYQNTCFGDVTAFSIPSQDPLATVLWDFGDGNTSTSENPTHTYALAGDYTVSVTITLGVQTNTETRKITIHEVPVAHSVSNVEVCHPTSTFNLDLATLDAQVLGAQSPATFEVGYFTTQLDADNNTNPVMGPTNFNEGITTVYARITNISNLACFDTTNFDVVVKLAPQSPAVTDWVVCDDDGDGAHTFDLTLKDSEILNGQSASQFAISYHSTQTDADNATNPIASNHVSNLPLDPIFYRIRNTLYPECFVTGSFHVGVIDQVFANVPNNLEICDDNNDGSATFDLSSVETEVLGTQSPTSVTISYHESQSEADNGLNPLQLNYTSSSYQKSIYVRVANTLDSSCYATTFFQLNIFDTPEISNVKDWTVCDDDNDSEYLFDFNSKGNEILGGTVDIVISFYTTVQDAELSQHAISGNYSNTSNPQTIYYRLENANNPSCFSVGNFDLQIFDTPTAYQPTDIVVCDDAETGSYAFDLSQKDGEVLNGQDPSIYEVSYYTNELNALNAEDSVTKNSYANVAASEILYARVQHSQLASCYDVTSFNLIVNPLPRPDLESTYVICPDSPELVVDAGLFESYSWRDPQGSVTDNIRTLDVVELGNYELTVSQTQFGVTCSNTISFEVVSSGAPDSFTVTNNGFSDEIILTIDAIGIGDFEYSLDGINFQTANQFQVFPGEYSVFVRDPYGCRTLSKDVIALGYQRFFSPNGDGTNETWNIIGGQLFPDSRLFIYDRYGKLLGQISPRGQGWDGTFSGKPLPSADYWFRYDYDNGKTHTGHFSLIR